MRQNQFNQIRIKLFNCKIIKLLIHKLILKADVNCIKKSRHHKQL